MLMNSGFIDFVEKHCLTISKAGLSSALQNINNELSYKAPVLLTFRWKNSFTISKDGQISLQPKDININFVTIGLILFKNYD